MEGTLATIAAAHPGMHIYRVARHVLAAWIPDEPGSLTGSLTCAADEDELAEELAAKYGLPGSVRAGASGLF